ncbi:hypothetical protein K8O93_22105 [Gordonia bronchialis]|uniref:hypothetical protein n=1 Tax=Gordonia bronchialis TaxID=2054 RepID=UPI001CC1684C|nr:hypothetical protein [Gordonia bronchialis]UAK37738.1 hypothetical protein K8O93_22105 [Gordonia bronchialis]
MARIPQPGSRAAGRRPNTDTSTVPARPGAVLALVGGVLVIASYFLSYYRLEVDDAVTVNGWGSASEPGYDVATSRLHWVALIAAIAVIVIALARLLRPAESTGEAWHQAAIACLVAALCGALISLAVVPDGTVSDIGVYVALAGSLAGAAGCALMAFTRR